MTKKIEIAIMVEGQNGLTWARWQRIAEMVEDLGFAGLYRSDHFTNGKPPDLDSLELWVSLTWLASHTRRIAFGSLVSPVSFRHPAMTARMASAVDDLSGGRLRLGLGAGWQVREHEHYGFDLLALPQRFERFQEGLEIITHLFKNPEPLTFKGKYFQTQEAVLLPRPQQAGGPPIVIGGTGKRFTLPLVARYGVEWNALFIPPEEFITLNGHLDQLLRQNQRSTAEVRRTMMTGLIFGRDQKELQEKLNDRKAEDLRKNGIVFGTPEDVIKQIKELEKAGVQRVMLQWLELDDLERLEAFARLVLPHFASIESKKRMEIQSKYH